MAEDKFEAAVNVIRSLPKEGPYQPSHDMMLKFYGLYKQATEGPCNYPKPAFYEVVRGYKWKAWSCLGEMSKLKAMETYVEELKKIIETMSYSGDVARFLQLLGPFYEYVEIPGEKDIDTNHNKTEMAIGVKKLKDNDFEIINGEREAVVPNMNGHAVYELNSSSENFDEKYEQNVAVNGLSSGENSPIKTRASPSVNGLSIDESGEESEMSETEHTAAVVSALADHLVADTDTDEEYSEPAETPELLLQQKTRRSHINSRIDLEVEDQMLNVYEYQNDAHIIASASYKQDVYSPLMEVIICGGGDASEAGRIKLTSPHQNNPGSGFSEQVPLEGPAPNMPAPSNPGGGGGRKRDSDRRGSGRGVTSEEINSQLLLLLQKIHQDLQAVVLRLDSLEAHALSQHQELCAVCQRRLGRQYSSAETSSWWPFPELSPRSTFFLLTWPLILHGAIKLLILLRSRKRRSN